MVFFGFDDPMMRQLAGLSHLAVALDDEPIAIGGLGDCSGGTRFQAQCDAFRGGKLSGWAVDLEQPDAAVKVTLVVEGLILNQQRTAILREDVLPWLSPNCAGFEFTLSECDLETTSRLAMCLSALMTKCCNQHAGSIF